MLRGGALGLMLVAACYHDVPLGSGDASGPTGDARSPDSADAPAPPPPPTSPRLLTIRDPQATDDEFDVPVLVLLDPTRIDYSQVGDPATDIVFQDPATTSVLNFEVASWNPGGKSELWLLLDDLPMPGASVDMSFGKGLAGTTFPNDVWDANYRLVEHLGSDVQELTDSSELHTGDAAIAGSPTIVAGQIGAAVRLSGSGDAVTFPSDTDLFDADEAFTFEFWLYGDYSPVALGASEPVVFTQGASLASAYVEELSPSELGFVATFQFADGESVTQGPEVTPQTWTAITYTFDGGRLVVYANGVQQGAVALIGSTHLQPGTTFSLGSLNAGLPELTGAVDEVRFGAFTASATYVEEQYLSETDQLVTYSDPP